MADNELKIKISATDDASVAIGEVSGSLTGLNDVGVLVGQNVAAAWRDVGAAAWEIAQNLGAVTGKYITTAGDAELISAKLNAQLVALGDDAPMTRKGLDDIANGMSKVTRFDDEAILQAEGRLLSFTSVGKDQFPLVMSAAADLAEQMGMGLPEAVQLLGRALETGTVTTLKRAGVVFDETTNKMITSLIEAGDTGKAQEMMLKGIEDRIGGVAEAAGTTFVGQMTIMQTQMDNFREGTGQKFIDLFMDLPQPIKDTSLALKEMGGDITPLILPTVQLAGALGQLKAAGGLGGVAKIGGIFTAFVFSPIFLGLAGLLAQLAIFKIGWDQNWFGIQDTFKLTGDTIRGIFKVWKLLLSGDFAGAAAEWGLLWDNIGLEIKRRIGIGFDAIPGFLKEKLIGFFDLGSAIVTALWNGISGGWEWLKTMVAGKVAELIASIKDALHMSPQYFTYDMGVGMAQDLAKGFGGMIPATAGSISNMAMSVPSGGGSRGGTNVFNVTVAPILSMANQFELESALAPIVQNILRKIGK